MPYILNTAGQVKEMLKTAGCSSLEELFSHLPGEVKVKGKLPIPAGLSEKETLDKIKNLAGKDKSLTGFNSFLGAGIYYHYLPAALSHICGRSEFYTAYTPYQAECSQGTLQAIFEYQTYVCLLTGMDVSNASMYDGATAVSESVLMAARIRKKKKFFTALGIHPEYRRVLSVYTRGLGAELTDIPLNGKGQVDLRFLSAELDESCAGILLQTPNFFGIIEDVEKISALAREKNVMTITAVNPFSLALLNPPGRAGADIVCGEGQCLGSPMNMGGPGFGFISTRKEFFRQIPGRIVGKTRDGRGRTGFCLTLQAREQHIRRQNATSNICSNHSLNAIRAAVYLSLLGKSGFEKAALYAVNSTRYLFQRLKETERVEFLFSGPFFNEFVWKISKAADVLDRLREKGVIAGFLLEKFYPGERFRDCILSSCTEIKTKEEIDSFISLLSKEL